MSLRPSLLPLLLALFCIGCGDKDDGGGDGGTDSGSGCVAADACATACRGIYGEDACGLQAPGKTTAELIDLCTTECEDAAAVEGGLGEYDPDTIPDSGEVVRLETCEQALAWLDCVDRRTCEDLEAGYCAPIF